MRNNPKLFKSATYEWTTMKITPYNISYSFSLLCANLLTNFKTFIIYHVRKKIITNIKQKSI